MELVAGRRLEPCAAVLAGFRRGRLRGQLYPGLVPDAAARVAGVLWEGLDRTVLARIDRFEGALYERQRCEVAPAAGEPCAAYVYVLAPAHRARLLPHDWDEAEFRALHLPDYLEACRAFARELGRAGRGSSRA
jgi:gamma-glutamylcyclotransferase (GGCT)/AIG2-like uncharacterized protein YtfP